MLLAVLLLAGCSTITVGSCAGPGAGFEAKEQHRSMVIHPSGCYLSWAQETSPAEAERLALLHCSEANPDSDASCKIIATDRSICPRGLTSWIQERLQNEDARETIRSEEQCEYGPALEFESAKGKKPHPVHTRDSVALKQVVDHFNLGDFDVARSARIVFGRAPESKGNWVLREALHFVTQKDGTRTCILRVSNEQDPHQFFATLFKIQLLGCYAA